jgi:hypothetical protein
MNTFIGSEYTRGRVIEPFLLSTWGKYCIQIWHTSFPTNENKLAYGVIMLFVFVCHDWHLEPFYLLQEPGYLTNELIDSTKLTN